jgi:hypothetical protein
MGIYENPGSYGEDPVDTDPLFPQIDPVQRAAEEQRNRLKIMAEQRAEREAKEAEKKAEKDARIAQKMAEKATKDLEKKAEKVADTTDEAKEKVRDAKDTIAEMSQQVRQDAIAITEATEGVPVEMAFTEGSEYIAELKEGEEAIFDLSQSVEKVESVIDLADEVSEKAEALARARAALSEVVSGDMGVGSTLLQESVDVFGAQGPAQDIRDRLRTAWEPEQVSTEQPTALPLADARELTVQELGRDDPAEQPLPSVGPTYTGASAVGPSYSSYEVPGTVDNKPYTAEQPTAEPQSRPLPFGRGLRSATTFAGGFIAGRAGATKKGLERVEQTLRSQVEELRSDTVATQPVTDTVRSETSVAPAEYASRPLIAEAPHTPIPEKSRPTESIKPPEVHSQQQDAIPSWIKQVESDVKKGKVLELKKWQRDVLKAQHPELLKRYDKLDAEYRLQIKHQSIEHTKSAQPQVNTRYASQSQPGDLPSFSGEATMPAFMRPPVPKAPPIMTPPTPVFQPQVSAYEYATQQSTEPIFSSAYITIVTIGGLVFGAFLISVFGL